MSKLNYQLQPTPTPTRSSLLTKFFNIISQTPYLIAIIYFFIIVNLRNLSCMLMFIGQCMNRLMNFILKRLIKQDRPYKNIGKGYGMPSTHSQFLGFTTGYSILLLYNQLESYPIIRIMAGLMVTLLCITVVYARVYLGYHTVSQVLVGLSLGLITAGLWYLLAYYQIKPTLLERTSFQKVSKVLSFSC